MRINSCYPSNRRIPEPRSALTFPGAIEKVTRILEFMRSDPSGIQIGIISDNMPNETFQIFEGDEEVSVAVSPFRLGELPNTRTGIATITTAPDAVKMYYGMVDRLWADAAKDKKGAKLLKIFSSVSEFAAAKQPGTFRSLPEPRLAAGRFQ